MTRPISWRPTLALALLLAGACTRVPADVSDPSASASKPEQGAAADATRSPLAGDCVAAELELCAATCSDRDCLDWCGGPDCVATVASLHACIDEAEQRFASEHPAPKIETETVVDDGEQYERPTDASLDRQSEWEAARHDALEQRWTEACAPICAAALQEPEAYDPPRFCRRWRSSKHAWRSLTQPPSEAGFLALANVVALAGLMGETTIGLAGKLGEPASDSKAAALQAMVNRTSSELRPAEGCVPNLDQVGREFSLVVELDPRGKVAQAQPSDAAAEARCVADRVAAAFTLPARVARDYPRLEVVVHLRRQPSIFDDMDIDNAGLLDSTGWGDDYGGLGESGLGGVDDSDDYGGAGSLGGWGD